MRSGDYLAFITSMKILAPPQSGSIAGQTASRNRYGQYLRTRAIPVNPSSTPQTIVRMQFGDSSAAWKALTNTKMMGWDAWAAAHPVQDSLGQSVVLSGQAFFVRVNAARLSAGLASQSAPPTVEPPMVSTLTFTSFVAATGVMTIAFTVDPIPAATSLVIQAGPPMSPGSFYVPTWRQIWTLPAAGTSPATPTTYAAKFGAGYVGARVFVRAAFVNEGGRGAWLQASVLMT